MYIYSLRNPSIVQLQVQPALSSPIHPLMYLAENLETNHWLQKLRLPEGNLQKTKNQNGKVWLSMLTSIGVLVKLAGSMTSRDGSGSVTSLVIARLLHLVTLSTLS